MGTKESLLTLLQENKGTFYSGEEIAEKLQISRTAVWKAVKSLRSAGYKIAAAQNKGYCLDANTDILTEEGIEALLNSDASFWKPEVLSTVDSTNTALREKANNGAPEGTAILSNMQTKGRGRLGRQFFSPPDTGIYMSLLLRPQGYSPAQAIRITTMAAVAAAEAIEEVSGVAAAIKWVNDIYMRGKKVCGILTEASFQLESGNLDYIVLGIGINAYTPDGGFPSEIEGIAGPVFTEQQSDGKNKLAAAFLNHFSALYRGTEENYAEKYRSRSFILGKPITVITSAGQKIATALDIDGDCRLVVRYDDGNIEALSSAEISIRV